MKVLHVYTISGTAQGFFNGQFKYLSENGGYEITVVASDDINEQFKEFNKIRFSKIDIARRIDIKTDLKSIKNLIKLIRKEKFDAVFGHTPKGAMVAMIASKLAGVKHRIYFRHGLIYTTSKGIKRFILKTVERTTAFFSTNIINVSPSLSGLAIKEKLNSPKKQTIIGKGTCGGIDTKNLFNPEQVSASELDNLREELGIGKSDFVIGYCGRICKEKGVRELIDGFKIFKETHPECIPKLLLVGSYDTRDILPEDYKQKIENEEDIIYVGRIEKNFLPKYYSLMDIFLFPSYREGFGMCVIEAGAMQVPALVSRSHGCVDSIVENETGEYINISPESVSLGIESFLDKDKREIIGLKAREHTVKHYENEVLWPKILDFYHSIIKN